MRRLLLPLLLAAGLSAAAQPRPMLRMGAVPLKIQDGIVAGPSIGLEHPLTPHVSLVGQADAVFWLLRQPDAGSFAGFGIGAGPRYYFNLQAEADGAADEQRRAGYYLHLLASLDFTRKGQYYFDPTVSHPQLVAEPGLLVYFGEQEKLGKRFLLDSGLGFGLRHYGTPDYLTGEVLRRNQFAFDASIRLYFVR